MTILPSTSLINQYNEISEKCKQTGEPIYLTKNGEVDLVVMSIEAFEKQQALLKLKERLLDIELEQSSGAKYYSLDDLYAALINEGIDEIEKGAKGMDGDELFNHMNKKYGR